MKRTITNTIKNVCEVEYRKYRMASRSSLFYEFSILLAIENSQLGGITDCRYITYTLHDQILCFIPLYKVDRVSNFGNNAKVPSTAYITHTLYCSDTDIFILEYQKHGREILSDIRELLSCRETFPGGVFALNLTDRIFDIVESDKHHKIEYMWNCFTMQPHREIDLEQFICDLPQRGRSELSRQTRKYDEVKHLYRIDSNDQITSLEEIVDLVIRTSSNRGTPNYYKKQELLDFICFVKSNIRVFSVKSDESLLGVLICIEYDKKMLIWCAGMRYDKSPFSPYTILFWEAIKYSFNNDLMELHAGRTTEKIKLRLGFQAEKRYSLDIRSI